MEYSGLTASFFVFVVTWLLADMRTHGRSVPSFDAFWLVWSILPVHLPYHLYSTRRCRGLLLLAGIVVFYLLPFRSIATGALRECAPAAPIGRFWAARQLHR